MRKGGTSVGLYFRGKSKEETNALRARLNEIAGELGYLAQGGRTTGRGNLAAMLVDLAEGGLEVVVRRGDLYGG